MLSCALSVFFVSAAAAIPGNAPDVVSEFAGELPITVAGCTDPAVSRTGRFVAFSVDTTLGLNDLNGAPDIFVKDMKTGALEMISRNPSGGAGNAASTEPWISENGRYVAFRSLATNLVAGVTLDAGVTRVFVFDREQEEMSLGSVTSTGAAASCRDVVDSFSLSPDGKFLGFVSEQSNVVPGHSNPFAEVYVVERSTGVVEHVSVATSGDGDGHAFRVLVAKGGRFVFFDSTADNLVSDDANGFLDVFVRDREKDQTTRLSKTIDGTANVQHSYLLSITPSGSFAVMKAKLDPVAFPAHNGYLVKRKTGKVSAFGPMDDTGGGFLFGSSTAEISTDGRYIAYVSDSATITDGPEAVGDDVFVYDRVSKQSKCRSLPKPTAIPNGESSDAVISSDGRWLVFESLASGLDPADTDAKSDILRVRL